MRQASACRDPLLPIGLPALPVAAARPIVLRAAERERLKKMAYGHKTEYRTAHARADRAAWPHAGRSNARIARETGAAPGHRAQLAGPVRRDGLAGSGRPRRGRAAAVVHPGAGRRGQGAGLPAARPRPACRWRAGRARSWPARSSPAASPTSISASTVRRWLAEDALKPWQHRSWIFIRDPDFAAKAAPGAGPVRPHLRGRAARRGRVRHLRRREDLHPGPLPLPPHPAPGPGPARCGSTTSTTAAAPWPTWPPTTSTAARSSAAASPPPASCRSWPWSTRS